MLELMLVLLISLRSKPQYLLFCLFINQYFYDACSVTKISYKGSNDMVISECERIWKEAVII
jgi:hypothetical protein